MLHMNYKKISLKCLLALFVLSTLTPTTMHAKIPEKFKSFSSGLLLGALSGCVLCASVRHLYQPEIKFHNAQNNINNKLVKNNNDLIKECIELRKQGDIQNQKIDKLHQLINRILEKQSPKEDPNFIDETGAPASQAPADGNN